MKKWTLDSFIIGTIHYIKNSIMLRRLWSCLSYYLHYSSKRTSVSPPLYNITQFNFIHFSLLTLAWKCLKIQSTWPLDFKTKVRTFLEWSSINVTKYDAPPIDLLSIMQISLWTKSKRFGLLWWLDSWKETLCHLLGKK